MHFHYSMWLRVVASHSIVCRCYRTETIQIEIDAIDVIHEHALMTTKEKKE